MRKVLLFGIAIALGACGTDGNAPTSPTPASISGSYMLETVDGQALPITVVDLGAYQAKLASAVLNLKPDGSYAFEFGIRIDDSGRVRTQTSSDAGAWSSRGDSLTLTSTAGDVTRPGLVSGKTLTLQSSTRVFVMRK